MDTIAANRSPHPAHTVRGPVFTAEPQPTLLMTLAEVAGHLRCTRRSIERQVSAGHLHVVHIGRAVRVERAELERYLTSLRDVGHAG